MKLFILYSLLITLSLTHQSPVFAQADYTAKVKAVQPPHASDIANPVLAFTGTINSDRILLAWTLGKNQLVDQIEVEKSTDKKKFVMAGLVFGTDQPNEAEYLFYERNKKSKSFYRLKIINKDGTVTYSPSIAPKPAITQP
jgi:hypothetical protein